MKVTLPHQLQRVEAAIGLHLDESNLYAFFFKVDKFIVAEHVNQGDKEVQILTCTLYDDAVLVSSFILSHNFVSSRRPELAAAYHNLNIEPIMQTLTNVDRLIRAENPLTLKYLYIAMHDLNLANVLTVLGYFSDLSIEGTASRSTWTSEEVQGVSFNNSVRFEVYQTVPNANDSLDNEPQAFIKVLFNESVI